MPGVSSCRHISINPRISFKSFRTLIDTQQCTIVPRTVLIPYAVHYASDVCPAQPVLFELYSFSVSGPFRDGMGVYLPRQTFSMIYWIECLL